MDKLTQTLLTGAALCALMAAPANSQPAHPAMHVTALHAGHAVNKTKLHGLHDCRRYCSTYTFGVYSSASASSVNQDIYGTYYKFNSAPNGYFTLCSNPKQKVKTPKRTVFGGTIADTETYSFGCPSGPTVFHGDAWTNKTGVPGNVDFWRSSLKGKFIGPSGGKYKGTLEFYVDLTITQ